VGWGGVGKIVVPRPSASASLTGRRQKCALSNVNFQFIQHCLQCNIKMHTMNALFVASNVHQKCIKCIAAYGSLRIETETAHPNRMCNRPLNRLKVKTRVSAISSGG
jgi:hypothetical protein